MSLRNRLFLLIESLLLLSALWQLITAPFLLTTVVMALVIFILLLFVKQHRRFWSVLQLISGGVIGLCLLFLPSLWLMLVVALLFAFLGKGAFFNQKHRWRWQKPNMYTVKMTEEVENQEMVVQRNNWFGNEQIGDQIFAWNDIDLLVIAGDTIIDLGQTILPATDNVIVVRKGFGRTRILVPIGVGILLTHTTLAGKVSFENHEYELNSEQLKIKSAHYEESHRRIRIITSSIVGNLEVVRV